MRLTTKTALALPGTALLLLAGATGASADEFDMKLTDTMGNKSGSSSTAQLTVEGDSLSIKITGQGFTPNSPHAQHFHGSFSDAKKFTCPDSSADADGDGQVNTEEGLPAYGDIVLSLTTSGDTSPESGLAIDRMPTADAAGNLSYERTIELPAGAGAKLKNLHVVQHGLDANGNDKYDLEALGESSFAKSLGVDGIPEEATNPATCGTVTGASTGEMPQGGVDTGDGTTGGTEAVGAFGLAGAAFAAAGGALLYRRRFATDRA
ncbi:hypothetical protein N802_03970 [Knoellia sinensis KCTC 19936]|uniref:CHRD domain-containing protein n=1 Tax=Knoellia sinensis KCTC 19936 TaxID=1385520 RepID=A0A0A0J2G6_9MICO|nr:hypothetical protein [Knoellia sinensis]KGN31535.1 hypothetical protein N802_03970 [Knoellia sinensis KCTC 19936]